MKKAIFTILIVLHLSTVLAQEADNDQEKDSTITLKEYNKRTGAQEEVVLVYFSADWCMVCTKMKPIIAQIEKDLTGKVKVLSIDTERDKEIKSEFEIDALPIVLLYKNGVRIWTHFGLLDLRTLCSEIEMRL